MRARAELTAAPALSPGGPPRLLRLRDAAPVAWRPTPDAVYLVGTAASPVGDDRVEIDVQLTAGATLQLRSAAATVAWRASRPPSYTPDPIGPPDTIGRPESSDTCNPPGTPDVAPTLAGTTQQVTASVADGACLDWHLEPFIATAGCHHRQAVRLQLEGTGRVHWVEELILGRHGEQPGRLDLRLDVDVNGAPLLRHQLVLGPGVPGWDGPAVIGPYRCVGLVLDAGGPVAPGSPRRSAGATPGGSWTVLELEGPGTLTLALGHDLPALRHALADAAVAVAVAVAVANANPAAQHQLERIV